MLEAKSRAATTIKDVARMAGVSVATASYVVNETRNVRPETRHRVLTAIQRLGYAPNAAARNLAAGRSFILGLIVSDIRNPFFPEIITGFQEAASVRNMEAIILNTNYDAARTREAVNRLTALQAPGVAVMTSQIDASVISLLPRKRVSAVYLDLGRVDKYISNITADYEGGIQAALDHIVQFGHERIGFIGGNPALTSAWRRRQAFLSGAAKAGLKEIRAIDSNFTVEGGYYACSKLLSGFDATAIIAANDLMAIGAMHAAYDRNLRIPVDLSIMGFDDITFAQFAQPALTTVALPRSEIGRVAFQALWTTIADDSHAGSEFCMETRLAIRQSTGPAPR